MSNKYDTHVINNISDQFTDDDSYPDPNQSYYISPLTKQKGVTRLMKYILLKKEDKVLKEIKEVKDIDEPTEGGLTGLMIAVRNSRTLSSEHIVETLLEHKADTSLCNKVNNTSVLAMASIFSGSDSTEKTVEIILNHNADVNLKNKDGCTALIGCTFFTRTTSTEKTVEILLNHKADLDIQNNNGLSALMIASRYANDKSTEKTVEILLNRKANVNLQKGNGLSAIIIASRSVNSTSSEKTVELLLRHGAIYDPKTKDMEVINTIMRIDLEIKNERLNDKSIWKTGLSDVQGLIGDFL